MSNFQKGLDDWICPDIDCKNVNYARRTHCHRCKMERKDARKATAAEKNKLGTEIGKQAADKSRGLFSAEDWQCSQCANVNWSRRQTCNMCNAPKFTDVEERTGSGGGYNERGTVEYKERVPSDDDEFDEFGRRKKKITNFKLNDRNSPRKSNKGEDEEDEDDEDDEEGDLSKYNLWDSDGEEIKEKDTNKEQSPPPKTSQKHRTRSRSRSRSRSGSPSSRKQHGGSGSHRKRRHSPSSSSSGSSYSDSRSSNNRHRRR